MRSLKRRQVDPGIVFAFSELFREKNMKKCIYANQYIFIFPKLMNNKNFWVAVYNPRITARIVNS
jgi:hypothetical protein